MLHGKHDTSGKKVWMVKKESKERVLSSNLLRGWKEEEKKM